MENMLRNVCTSQDALFLGYNSAAPLLVAMYQRVSGDITLTEVLGQSTVDNFLNLELT
jgi:hypothetical protein